MSEVIQKNPKRVQLKLNEEILLEKNGQSFSARVMRHTKEGIIYSAVLNPSDGKVHLLEIPEEYFVERTPLAETGVPEVTEIPKGTRVAWLDDAGSEQIGIVVAQEYGKKKKIGPVLQVYNEKADEMDIVLVFDIWFPEEDIFEHSNAVALMEGFRASHVSTDEKGNILGFILSFWEKRVANISFEDGAVKIRDIDVQNSAAGLETLFSHWLEANKGGDKEPFATWLDWQLNFWVPKKISDKEFFNELDKAA